MQLSKTVAVKMVRSQINAAAMESLVSEWRILTHLGSHLNVVNLLRASTRLRILKANHQNIILVQQEMNAPFR